jgi:outer membrane protein assembly factor BamB
MMSSFVVADGVGVVLCGHLFGLDVPTGELLWQGDPMRTQGTHSSPAVWSNGGKSYVLCNVAGKDTICVAPKTGEELWRVQSQAGLSTPLVVGDRMITYGRSRKDGVRCFELSVAKELWANNGLADKGSSPVVVDGRVYVQGERRLACIDLETGKTNWRTLLDLDQPEYTSPIAADEKVFYVHDGVLCFEARADRYAPLFEAKMDEDGLLAGETQHREKLGIPELEKSEGGREKAADLYRRKVSRHGPLRCTSPAIAQGKLIVRRPNGLVCYDLSAPSVASRKDQD